MAAPSGWDATKHLKVVVDARNTIDLNQSDVPVPVVLSNDCGATNHNAAKFFDGLSDSYCKILIHSDHPDGSTDIVNSALDKSGIVLLDSVAHSTDQAKFGNSSIKFIAGTRRIAVGFPNQYIVDDQDFTLDFWSYTTLYGGQTWVESSLGTVNIKIYCGSINEMYFYVNNTQGLATTRPQMPLNEWVHVALVGEGGTATLYLNGTATDLVCADYSGGSGPTDAQLAIGNTISGNNDFQGYLDEFRFCIGKACWDDDFTPPTTPYSDGKKVIIQTSLGEICDAELVSFNSEKPNTRLLIHSDHLDDSTDIEDSSIYGANERHTITLEGDASHQTDQYKFGASSIYCETISDYVKVVDNNHDFNHYRYGLFTIDFWVRLSSLASNAGLFFMDNVNGTNFWLIRYEPTDGLTHYCNTMGWVDQGNTTGWVVDTWHHIAIVGDATTIKVYLDGTQVISDGRGQIDTQSNPMYFGVDPEYSSPLNGYIDEIRFTANELLWTSSFTPPTAPAIDDVADGSAIYHVKTPTVAENTLTVLDLYYDGLQDEQSANIGFIGESVAQGVWDDNFVFVCHYNQNPGLDAPQLLDSTSYGKHGTCQVNMDGDDLIDGDFGKLIKLDGSDFYVSHPYNAAHSITDTLTLEALIRPNILLNATSLNADDRIINRQGQNPLNNSYGLFLGTDGHLQLDSKNGNIRGTKVSWAADTEFIVAGTYDYNSGNEIGDLFVDGVKEVLTNNTLDILGTTTDDIIIGTAAATGAYLDAAIGEIRISNIVRSDDWIALTHALLRQEIVSYGDSPKSLSWDVEKGFNIELPVPRAPLVNFPVPIPLSSVVDANGFSAAAMFTDLLPYGEDEDTVLLIQSDHVDGSVDIVDESQSGHTVTVNSTTEHSTDEQKFGSSSIYFNGTSNYLSIPYSSDFDLGTLYTLDFWVYIIAQHDDQYIVRIGGDTTTHLAVYVRTDGKLGIRSGSVTSNSLSVSALAIETWYHIALVVTGGTWYLYIDGVEDKTYSAGTVSASAGLTWIGRTYVAGSYFDGYLDSFRISKGIARWTDDFDDALPTAAYIPYRDPYKAFTIFTENFEQIPVEIEAWDRIAYSTKEPPAYNTTYVKATDEYSSYYAYLAVNPALSLVGAQDDKSWIAEPNNSRKFNIDYGTAFVAKRVYLENFHHNGTNSTDIGIKDFNIYGTNSATAFSNVTYATTTDLTLLGSFTADAHISSNVVDPQYFDISDNTIAYRYYILRIANNQGQGFYIGIRHLEVQPSERFPAVIHTKVPYCDSAFDYYTKFLLKSDTTDGSTDFVDSSASAHVLTPGGDVHHETDQKKFGTSSMYFDGTAGELISSPDSSDWDFGTDDYTIDFWMFMPTVGNRSIMCIGSDHNAGINIAYYSNSIYFYYKGTSLIGAVTMTASTWHHVAIVRSGITTKIYFNGVEKATVNTLNSSFAPPNGVKIGLEHSVVISPYLGYLDEIRILKGRAHWTAAFTPPTRAYSLVSYPTTLTLYYDKNKADNLDFIGDTGDAVAQSVWDANFKAVYHMAQDPSGGTDCILDSTSNANHGTPAGTMLTEDLIDGLTGKAIEFDGTDDYIEVPDDNSLDIASNITIEALYYTAISANMGLLEKSSHIASWAGNAYSASINTTTDNSGLYIGSSPTYTTTPVPSTDQWQYFAGKYDAVNITGYIDGVAGTPVSYSSAIPVNANSIYIGGYFGNYYLNGKLGEIRISDVARSDAWIHATSLGLSGDLITFADFLTTFLVNTKPFILPWADNPVMGSQFLEPYNVGAIPKKFVEPYRLVEEKAVAVPTGWSLANRLTLRVDSDKVETDEDNFMALVHLDQPVLFDAVRNPLSAPSIPGNATILWVSPDGDDTNVGSEEFPYKTIYAAYMDSPGLSQIRLKPGRYIETQRCEGWAHHDVYFVGATGDYRDVIIQTPAISNWIFNGSYAWARYYYLTIESHCTEYTVQMNSEYSYFYDCFLSYKGVNTGHVWWYAGSSIYSGYVLLYNCTVFVGVGEMRTYSPTSIYNTIVDKAFAVGNHFYSCYPGSDGLNSCIDYNNFPPDFVEAGSPIIPFSSPCRDTGSSTYRSWYEGVAPDMGCHEVGNYLSRLNFTDVTGNPLGMEFIEWDDVNDRATFYAKFDADADNNGFLYVYYADEPTAGASTFGHAADGSQVLVTGHTDPNGASNNRSNFRAGISAAYISADADVIQIGINRYNVQTTRILSCFVGHQADGGNGWEFDGNQVRVTWDGGSSSKDISVSGVMSDPITFSLDSSKNLIVSIYVSEGTYWLGYRTDTYGTYLYYNNTNDEGVDQSNNTLWTPWNGGAYPGGDGSQKYSFIEQIIAPALGETYWTNYVSVLHGALDTDGTALDSCNQTEVTTSPVFDENYYINTPFGPALDLSYSSTAHLIMGDVFDRTAGTMVVGFNTDNTSVIQVLFATPASATTNQHKFEITTSGAIQITDAGGTTSLSTTTGFNDGEYHTVVFTWGASGRTVAVDKTVLTISNPTATFSTAPSSAVGLIGYDYVSKNAASASFDGVITEFRIADSVFTADQVELIGYSETDTLFDGTISSAQNVVIPYGAGPILQTVVEEWIIAQAINNPGVIVEPWIIMQPPNIQVFEEIWGIKLLNTIVEVWGDSAKKKAIFNEWYGDSAVPINWFTEEYGNAIQRRAVYSLLWMMYSNPIAVMEENYALTEDSVRTFFEETYDLRDMNAVRAVKDLVWHLLDEGSTTESPDTTVVVETGSGAAGAGNGVLQSLDFLSIQINAGLGQYCISCDIELPTEAQYSLCQYKDNMTITLGGTEYVFFVESRERNISLEQVTYSIGLLSPTAQLDTPYALTIVDQLNDGTMAQALVERMAALGDITVDWQIVFSNGESDWMIPGYAIAINDETPLAVIKKVVNAVGGVVQTKPNGDMLIISKYTISVPNWSMTSPAYTFSTLEDILTLSESLDVKDGYNAFQITDQGSSSESINLVVEDGEGLSKIVKGYRVPFDDGPFPLETSGAPGISIDKYAYPVETQIPIRETNDDPEWEVVEFISHTGSTSLPIYEVVDFEWIIDDLGDVADLGAFQVSEDGTLTVINTDAVPGESLLRIKYITKYWQWTVTGPTDRPVQFYVPEITEE